MKTDSDRLKIIARETAIAALATGAGAWAAHRAGFALFPYVPNVAAIALGAAALFWPAAIIRIVRKYGVVALAALMMLTLFTSGTESVHRWIPLGPILLNVSMAVAPAILFLIWNKPGRASLLLAVFTASIYVLQPDAGQAAAFAVSACLLITGVTRSNKLTDGPRFWPSPGWQRRRTSGPIHWLLFLTLSECSNWHLRADLRASLQCSSVPPAYPSPSRRTLLLNERL